MYHVDIIVIIIIIIIIIVIVMSVAVQRFNAVSFAYSFTCNCSKYIILSKLYVHVYDVQDYISLSIIAQQRTLL